MRPRRGDGRVLERRLPGRRDPAEMLGLLLPTLRADLTVCARYRGTEDVIDVPITAFAGTAPRGTGTGGARPLPDGSNGGGSASPRRSLAAPRSAASETG